MIVFRHGLENPIHLTSCLYHPSSVCNDIRKKSNLQGALSRHKLFEEETKQGRWSASHR